MNNVVFGFACGSIRALRAKASSDTFRARPNGGPGRVSPTDPIGPSGRR